MLLCKCASCGIMKTQFISGQTGGAVGAKDYSCGINLRGKRPGTVEECFKSGQIRRYGQKIAEDLDILLADKAFDRQQKAKAARMAIAKDPIRSEINKIFKMKVGETVVFQDAAVKRVARNKYDLMTEDETFGDLTKNRLVDYIGRAHGDMLTRSYQERRSRKTVKPKKPKTPSVWTDAKQKEYVDEIVADIKAETAARNWRIPVGYKPNLMKGIVKKPAKSK